MYNVLETIFIVLLIALILTGLIQESLGVEQLAGVVRASTVLLLIAKLKQTQVRLHTQYAINFHKQVSDEKVDMSTKSKNVVKALQNI